mmetsp:Transcript_59128/g.138507  ORF Transcript_59128/g.138507 Transcript_59128/m.138507 type:complete len:204 (-) Transcript_59128:1372-1983(-)
MQGPKDLPLVEGIQGRSLLSCEAQLAEQHGGRPWLKLMLRAERCQDMFHGVEIQLQWIRGVYLHVARAQRQGTVLRRSGLLASQLTVENVLKLVIKFGVIVLHTPLGHVLSIFLVIILALAGLRKVVLHSEDVELLVRPLRTGVAAVRGSAGCGSGLLRALHTIQARGTLKEARNLRAHLCNLGLKLIRRALRSILRLGMAGR